MAISITQLLSTDSLSGSRIILNDNFTILASEINAIENYFNPSSGVLDNVVNTQTDALRVGLSSPVLQVNSSSFTIISDVDLSGDLNINGGNLIRNNVDPQTLDDVFAGGSTIGIGSSSAPPPYTIERVNNDVSTVPVAIEVYEGSIGQELIFVYSGNGAGTVQVQAATGASFVLENSGSSIQLTGRGQSVHLLSVDDGTGNAIWMIIGGTGFTTI